MVDLKLPRGQNRVMTCPYEKQFRKAANMSASEIVAWMKLRKRSCSGIRLRSNGRSAVDELAQVARMVRTPASRWSDADCKKARDLSNFVKRHTLQKSGGKCSRVRLIALRDWAFHPKGCPVPKGADVCKKTSLRTG